MKNLYYENLEPYGTYIQGMYIVIMYSYVYSWVDIHNYYGSLG